LLFVVFILNACKLNFLAPDPFTLKEAQRDRGWRLVNVNPVLN